jgi:hypothetical protein
MQIAENMTPYPVFFSIARPERFDRVQLALRIALLVVLSIFGLTIGAISSLLYLGLPIAAAMAIRSHGSRFLADGAPRFVRALRAILGAYAYAMLLIDRVPEGDDDRVTFAIEPGAWHESPGPTVGVPLLRGLYALPSAFVLAILSIPAWIVWLVAAVMILFTEEYPTGLHDFQCGILRWQARLYAYEAGLVEAYPPFALDAGALPSAPHEPLPH